PAALKYKPMGAEPVPMSIAEARKLGISLGHDGTLRVDKNDFIMRQVSKGEGNKVLMDGKILKDDEAPLSVHFEVTKSGIRLKTVDGQEVKEPVTGAMLSGTAAARSKLVPAAKAAGPLGIALLALFSPETAHAAVVHSQGVADTMSAGGLGMAI